MTSLIKYFNSAIELTGLINAYFVSVGVEETIQPRPSKNKLIQYNPEKTRSVVKAIPPRPSDGKHDPPTITGLALFLGFESLAAFETYEARGRYPHYLKRARLLIPVRLKDQPYCAR